jgi:hypothetical protein
MSNYSPVPATGAIEYFIAWAWNEIAVYANDKRRSYDHMIAEGASEIVGSALWLYHYSQVPQPDQLTACVFVKDKLESRRFYKDSMRMAKRYNDVGNQEGIYVYWIMKCVDNFWYDNKRQVALATSALQWVVHRLEIA